MYLAVPDKRRTFDRKRQSTTFEHLLNDFENGPEQSREAHYYDFVKNVNLAEGASHDEVLKEIQELKGKDYSIHFHVWTGQEFYSFLEKAIHRLHLPFQILEMRHVLDENIFILRKDKKL